MYDDAVCETLQTQLSGAVVRGIRECTYVLGEIRRTIHLFPETMRAEIQHCLENALRLSVPESKGIEEEITLEWRHKQRIEGRKAKEWVTTQKTIALAEVKETFVEIVFK